MTQRAGLLAPLLSVIRCGFQHVGEQREVGRSRARQATDGVHDPAGVRRVESSKELILHSLHRSPHLPDRLLLDLGGILGVQDEPEELGQVHVEDPIRELLQVAERGRHLPLGQPGNRGFLLAPLPGEVCLGFAAGAEPPLDLLPEPVPVLVFAE